MIYGPNTEAVQSVIDRISTLTEDECKQLAAARVAARDEARGAAWGAALYAARRAAWDEARGAAWDATWDASRSAARAAARDASIDAVRAAILATVTYDLATIDGHYTIAQRDRLMAPWVSVCGMPDGLIATAVLAGEG